MAGSVVRVQWAGMGKPFVIVVLGRKVTWPKVSMSTRYGGGEVNPPCA